VPASVDHGHRRVGARDGDEGGEALEVRALGAQQHDVAQLVPPRRRRRPGGVLQRARPAGAVQAAVVVQEQVHQSHPAVHEERRRDLRRQDRGVADQGEGVGDVLAQQEEDAAHGDQDAGVQGAAEAHHSRVDKFLPSIVRMYWFGQFRSKK
jgi:hypothetical protein